MSSTTSIIAPSQIIRDNSTSSSESVESQDQAAPQTQPQPAMGYQGLDHARFLVQQAWAEVLMGDSVFINDDVSDKPSEEDQAISKQADKAVN